MQDNFTNDLPEILIKYMDGELTAAENEATEKMLREDAALRERYQYLVAAKRAIKLQGIKQRVGAIHREYMQDVISEDKEPATIVKPRSSFKIWMRIAAIFIVLLLGYGITQYASTTNQSVYNDNFIAYQLPVNRGSEKTDNLDILYNEGNYNAVVNVFDTLKTKDQKAYFLAAQAYLQLNNVDAAINAFHQVENLNNKSDEKYFEQETDYYTALAYIKENNIKKAEEKLDKITSNKQHLFYKKAKEISRTKLMMLKWKEK